MNEYGLRLDMGYDGLRVRPEGTTHTIYKQKKEDKRDTNKIEERERVGVVGIVSARSSRTVCARSGSVHAKCEFAGEVVLEYRVRARRPWSA